MFRPILFWLSDFFYPWVGGNFSRFSPPFATPIFVVLSRFLPFRPCRRYSYISHSYSCASRWVKICFRTKICLNKFVTCKGNSETKTPGTFEGTRMLISINRISLLLGHRRKLEISNGNKRTSALRMFVVTPALGRKTNKRSNFCGAAWSPSPLRRGTGWSFSNLKIWHWNKIYPWQNLKSSPPAKTEPHLTLILQ